jgi:uncharacterized protein YgbK (DUF1537 family)
MIAVIADDFTGAAELAGISLKYGLKIELSLGKENATNADILIISTNSRSLGKADALHVTKKAVQNLAALKPSFIYKKIDSVLRGHLRRHLFYQPILPWEEQLVMVNILSTVKKLMRRPLPRTLNFQ